MIEPDHTRSQAFRASLETLGPPQVAPGEARPGFAPGPSLGSIEKRVAESLEKLEKPMVERDRARSHSATVITIV